jgi:formylglycine-generating enzyme required for sulfatase activity
MARLIVAAFLLALPGAAQDQQFKQAGVCARCHVISVVEWSIARHARASVDCVACHGVSEGHVIDERNNVKPERIPRAGAIPGLCATCHAVGCPKTKRKDACHTCHHAHALLNPEQAPAARDEALDRRTTARAAAAKRFAEGERLAALGRWQDARREFEAALQSDPRDSDAAARLLVCRRRLHPEMPGFEIVGDRWDRSTGLARDVRVAGLGIAMALVAGGEYDMGSERFPVSQPVRTVAVAPFYLGKLELTRDEWKAVMGTPAPGAGDDARLPVDGASWEDAQAFVAKLNARVPGAGFRLPIEAEWEFASRLPGTAKPAASPSPLRRAGSGRANEAGIHDLLGSVWEWCGNPWASGSPLRVLRGGAYVDSLDLVDAAMRHSERPNRRLPGNSLRIARTVPGLR